MLKRLRLKSNRGFAHLEFLLIIIVLLAIAGVGYWVWQKQGIDSSNKTSKNAEATKCGSGWYDSHAHLDDSELPSKLATEMQKHSVSCAVLFVQMNEDNYDEDLELYREDVGDAPSVFVPFFDVIRDKSTKVTREYLDRVYQDTDGGFSGVGEFALYRDELKGTDLTKEPWPTLYDFVADKNMLIMIHNDLESWPVLESVMQKYPKTKFLIHGIEKDGAQLAELLKKHDNLYFTLDTATLLKFPGFGQHLMYPDGEGSASRFKKEYAEHKDALMSEAKSNWSKAIIAAPDRVMWGTDVSFDWHVEPEVYALLMEFSEEFANSLPENMRNKFKYQNAVNIISDRAVQVSGDSSNSDDEDDDCDDLEEDCDEDEN